MSANLLMLVAAIGGMDYNSAYSQAKQHESALSPAQYEMLQQAEDDTIADVMEQCSPDEDNGGDNFVIVAAIDRSGRVVQTWRSGRGEFAVCAEQQIRNSRIPFNAPADPFVTAFEFSDDN